VGPDLGGGHVPLSNAGEMGRGEPILGTSTEREGIASMHTEEWMRE